MKKYFIIFLIISELKAQQNLYNIFEIKNGEILKQDYKYIEYLYDDLYSATIKNSESLYNQSSDLTGVIDENEKIIVPFKYTTIERLWDHDNKPNNSYIEISNISEKKGRGVYEIIDKSTMKKIVDGYLKIRYFVFNKTCITAYAGCYSICNLKTGNIIKTNFVDIEPLTDSTVATRDMNYRWGIADVNGNKIIENKYDKISRLTDSLIIIENRDSLGVINSHGKIIIPSVFRNIKTNSKIIFVQTYNNGKTLKLNEVTKNKLSDYSITLNKNNKITSKFYSVDLENIKQIGLYGAFDKKGNVIIPFEFEILENGIGQNIIGSKNNKFGILSPDGKNLIQHKYNHIESFYEKFYVIEINKKFGVINSDLNEILPTIYKKIIPISEDELLVLENLQWYKIRLDNDLKITKQKTNYNSSFDFSLFQINSNISNNYSYSQDYFLMSKNGLYGVVSKNLSVIIPANYNYNYTSFNNSYFEFQKNGNDIYFTLNGAEIKDLDLSGSRYLRNSQNVIICKKNGKYGVIDSLGNIIVPFKYTEITNIDEKKFIVKK